MSVEPPFQLRRVQVEVEPLEFFCHLRSYLVRFHKHLIWCFRGIVDSFETASTPFFAHQLHHRLKEVLVELQLLPVKLLDELQLLRRLVPQVAQRLADMG